MPHLRSPQHPVPRVFLVRRHRAARRREIWFQFALFAALGFAPLALADDDDVADPTEPKPEEPKPEEPPKGQMGPGWEDAAKLLEQLRDPLPEPAPPSDVPPAPKPEPPAEPEPPPLNDSSDPKQ